MRGHHGAWFQVPVDQLPYDPYDQASVLAHAKRLVGRTVADVANELQFRPIIEDLDRSKGKAGDLVESWFKLVRNQRPEPDLPCGIEIKVAPLRRTKTGFGSKERMVLGLIDFHGLIREEWANASIRPKIEHILFVVYMHDPADASGSIFQHTMLWSPPTKDLPQLRVDWTRTRNTVRDRPPDALTESLGRIMGPCTKGENKLDFAPHPYSPTARAMRRAFAFKGGYVAVQIKKELHPAQVVSGARILAAEVPQLALDDEKLAEVGLSRIALVEKGVLARLHALEGKTIEEVCRRLAIRVTGQDKSLAARLLDAILEVDDYEGVEELAEEGVQVKTIHASTTERRSGGLYPFEAMSFPAADLKDLLHEDWDEGTAAFPQEIDRLLLIPTFSPERDDPQAHRKFGRAFFWSPTTAQAGLIEKDWREIQDVVRNGGAAERPVVDDAGIPRVRKTAKRRIPMVANDLPGERPGHILHMRPHAADSDDKVPVPGGYVTRQCFWINKGFIQRLLQASENARNAGLEGVTI